MSEWEPTGAAFNGWSEEQDRRELSRVLEYALENQGPLAH